MDTITSEDALRSYKTREVKFERDTSIPQSQSTAKDSKKKKSQPKELSLHVSGAVLSLSYGAWGNRRAALILMHFKLKAVEVWNFRQTTTLLAFESCKQLTEAVIGNPPALRYYYSPDVGKGRLLLETIESTDEERDPFHQVTWSCLKTAGKVEGIPNKLTLAVVVEHDGPFQGMVKFSAQKSSTPWYVSALWTRYHPLRFDCTTEKGLSPLILDFSKLTEQDWKDFALQSPSTHYSAQNRLEHQLNTPQPPTPNYPSTRVDSTYGMMLNGGNKAYRVRGIPHDRTCEELEAAPEPRPDPGLTHSGVTINSFADNPPRQEKVATLSFKETQPKPAKGKSKSDSALIERFNKSLDDRYKRTTQYNSVAVLVIYWENCTDSGYKREAQQVGELFRKDFGYFVDYYEIPAVDSGLELDHRINRYLHEHREPETLLIIHYGGHGDPDDERGQKQESVWCAEPESDSPSLKWSNIQPKLEHHKSEVLLLLDCCYSSQAARDSQSRRRSPIPQNVELFAACGMGEKTASPGRYSFTSLLITELRLQLASEGCATIPAAHINMAAKESRLKQSAVYYPSKKKIPLEPVQKLGTSYNIQRAKETSSVLQLSIGVRDGEGIEGVFNWLKDGPTQALSNIVIEDIITKTGL